MDEQAFPRILPRSEHSLSRQKIDLDALKILYRLHGHGFLAYLVGGCVRDLLLGKVPKDFDIVTDAHPQQIRELFRNSRLIGRRFRLAHVYFRGGKFIEVATFRRRSEFEAIDPENPHLSENTFGTPAEDATRRDITINGLFYNIADFSIIDYVGGIEDLQRGIIRCIGDPEEKYAQDPVRMIRVIRHAARTGFHIEERTYEAIFRHVQKIQWCAPARIRDEFLRELREGSAAASMKLMMETGMLFVLFPFLEKVLTSEEARTRFLAMLSSLDQITQCGKIPEDEFSLALFLLPAMEVYCPYAAFPAHRRGWASFLVRIRQWIHEILGPLQFTGHAKEGVIQLLGAQKRFRDFLPHRKIPWHLALNPYFEPARQIFEIDSKARGAEVETSSWNIETKKRWPEKKGRRRSFRKRRFRPHQGPEDGAVHPPPEMGRV
jgi:poly(A) polymerase